MIISMIILAITSLFWKLNGYIKIWILVLSHVLINAAIIVLYSFDGISNKEELYHIIGHLIGLAGGVWLCVFIAKENSCKFNSDKHEEKLEESEEN